MTKSVAAITDAPIPAPRAQMTVSRITLFRSDRGKNGMIYTPLGTANAQADAFF